jgi:hypothetical protein
MSWLVTTAEDFDSLILDYQNIFFYTKESIEAKNISFV